MDSSRLVIRHTFRALCVILYLAGGLTIARGAEISDLVMNTSQGYLLLTVRIGDVLDSNLKTEIDGLYVCDASVFPEALDRPTVLTIIGLAKRLARTLI